MSRIKKLVLAVTVLAVLGIALVVGANAWVLIGGGSGNYTGPADAPHAQAALVLGAEVRPDGTPSAMLADRITVAARLYHTGKVDKLLVTGDHGTNGYDEVNPMRRELLDRGVPARDIFTDHAGFNTWDSVVRAKKVFRVSSALIVTQGFHMPRAVWLARQAGLKAHGVDADLHGYGGAERNSQLREVLARVKAVGEAVTDTPPRYLGAPIPITGDGNATRG